MSEIQQPLAGYKPRPEFIHLVTSSKENGTDWLVYFTPLACVADVACVLGGLGFECVVEPDGITDGFVVKPKDRAQPAPTQEQFAAILERGIPDIAAAPRFRSWIGRAN